jgi:hypothetical protein
MTRSEMLERDMETTGLDLPRLAELLIVPEVVVVETAAPTELYTKIGLEAVPAEGTKCPRCWQVRRDGDGTGLCGRCVSVVGGQ